MTRAAPNTRPFSERLRRLDDADIQLSSSVGDFRRIYRIEANSKGAQPHLVECMHVEPTGWIVESCDCDAFKHIKDARGCVHCERIRMLLGTSTLMSQDTFDPNKFVIKLKGKDYLPVAARLVWMRREHPSWGIKTTPIEINMEKRFAIFHCEIFDEEGKLLACGTKHEDERGFADFIEKAEKGSIGRALGVAGYGTDDLQGDDEYEAHVRPADAPVQRNGNAPRPVVQDYPVMNAEEAAEFAAVKKRILDGGKKLDKDKWAAYFARAIGKWETRSLEYIKEVESEVNKQVALLTPPVVAAVASGEEDPFADS